MAASHLLDPPQDACLRLYTDHHAWLTGWLRRKLGDAGDAADLAHDVFVRVLGRRREIDLRQPRAYLSTIARGLVIDHWRRRDLEQAWLDTLQALPPAQWPSAEQQAIILEALEQIDRMLDGLKPAVREAFLLARLDGLTMPEIAQRLDVSLATVERHIALALRHCYELRWA